jgi:hypothetical protein
LSGIGPFLPDFAVYIAPNSIKLEHKHGIVPFEMEAFATALAASQTRPRNGDLNCRFQTCILARVRLGASLNRTTRRVSPPTEIGLAYYDQVALNDAGRRMRL